MELPSEKVNILRESIVDFESYEEIMNRRKMEKNVRK
jgi:hypothetical protein